MSLRELPDGALSALERLVGPANLRQSSDLLVGGVRPGAEVLPEDIRQLEDALRVAAEFDLAVCPTGGSTKLGWGAPPRACDLLVRTAPLRARSTLAAGAHASGSLARGARPSPQAPALQPSPQPSSRGHSTPAGPLAAITSYDPDNLVVTAGAGVAVAALRDLAAGDGLVFPLDPPSPDTATLGGVLSTNDHGPHRLVHGSLRDVVLGLTAVLVGGERVRAGGRTIKNVTGYDLTRLFVGSFGSLGIVSEATVRLLPGPACEKVVVASMPHLGAAAEAVGLLRRSQLVPAAAEVLSVEAARMVDVLAGGLLRAGFAEADQPVAGSCVVIVAFEGHPVAVEREVRDTVRMLGEARSLVLADSEQMAGLWSALSRQRESVRSLGYAVEVKLSVPLSDLWNVLDLARSGEGSANESANGSANDAADGVPLWTASAGSGTARLWIGRMSTPPSDGQWTLSAESLALLIAMRTAAERKGGSLVVVDGGQALGGAFGAWGSDPDALAVMRALKSKFDPRGLMNPGRCAGGL